VDRDNNVRDRKANALSVKSKQKIFVAAMQLMQEKDYGAISISELSKRAEVDRRTFYRHFNSKEEITQLIIDEAFDKYEEYLSSLPQLDVYAVCKGFFEMLTQYRIPLLLLHKQGLLDIVYESYMQHFSRIARKTIAEAKDEDLMSWELTYRAEGFWSFTRRWIEEGAKDSPEEMARRIAAIHPSSEQT